MGVGRVDQPVAQPVRRRRQGGDGGRDAGQGRQPRKLGRAAAARGALACLDAAVDESERVLGLGDLRDDRGELELVDENTGEVIDVVPAPIAVVSDNGSCFRGETFQTAFAGDDPLLRHVGTRVRSPQTNGVIERFFGTLKYEHL